MSEDNTQFGVGAGQFSYEDVLTRIGSSSELLMDVLEILTAFIMVGLFAIGVPRCSRTTSRAPSRGCEARRRPPG
ncbi:hypothetical protein ACFQHP_11660 [Halomicroarcula sp. GCM10025743]|uniref:hypothetical protein n=1 Tax=Halomicroarcula sp. GCM10025743 TaxID=3252671 RepID=UPI003612A568